MFGSFTNAWPFLQLGGSEPVVAIIRHSMMVYGRRRRESKLVGVRWRVAQPGADGAERGGAWREKKAALRCRPPSCHFRSFRQRV